MLTYLAHVLTRYCMQHLTSANFTQKRTQNDSMGCDDVHDWNVIMVRFQYIMPSLLCHGSKELLSTFKHFWSVVVGSNVYTIRPGLHHTKVYTVGQGAKGSPGI